MTTKVLMFAMSWDLRCTPLERDISVINNSLTGKLNVFNLIENLSTKSHLERFQIGFAFVKV